MAPCCAVFRAGVVAAVAFGGASSAKLDMDVEFEEYITTFDRAYPRDSEEYALRKSIFQGQAQEIQTQNAKSDRLWTAGYNHLTDRTDAEYAELQGWRPSGAGRPNHPASAGLLTHLMERREQLAKTIDWRNLSSMKVVRDQGHCGSCWAVATANMLRAQYEIRKKTVRTFSPQQLVNCVPNPKECGGTGGCSGATAELAMQYVMENGLQDEDDAPYFAKESQCVEKPSSSFLSQRGQRKVEDLGLAGWSTLPENQAEPLMRAVMDGPVAISVAAKSWRTYSAGIFNGCDRDVVLGHAVLLMGYGEEASNKYWTVLNSWGSSFGEQGYIRLLRHDTIKEDDAYCGTDDRPEAGVECKPYRSQVTVCGMCGMLYDSVTPHFHK